MNLKKLQKVLADQPKFRFKQAWKAIFVDLISDWNDNTTLPKDLREVLNIECSMELVEDMIKEVAGVEEFKKVPNARHKDEFKIKEKVFKISFEVL